MHCRRISDFPTYSEGPSPSWCDGRHFSIWHLHHSKLLGMSGYWGTWIMMMITIMMKMMIEITMMMLMTTTILMLLWPFHSFLSPQGFLTLTRQTVPCSPAETRYRPVEGGRRAASKQIRTFNTFYAGINREPWYVALQSFNYWWHFVINTSKQIVWNCNIFNRPLV